MIGWVITGTIVCIIVFIACFVAYLSKQKTIDIGTTRKRILVHYDPDVGRMRIFALKHTMKDKNWRFSSEGNYDIVYIKSFMKSIPIKINKHPLTYEDKYNTYAFNEGFIDWINKTLAKEIDKLRYEKMQLESDYGELVSEVNELATKPSAVTQERLNQLAKFHKEIFPYALEKKKTTR